MFQLVQRNFQQGLSVALVEKSAEIADQLRVNKIS